MSSLKFCLLSLLFHRALSFGESADWVEFGKRKKFSQIINDYTILHIGSLFYLLFILLSVANQKMSCLPPLPPSKGKMMSKWEAFFVHAVVSVIKERRPRAYVQKWCVHRFRCPNMVTLRATGEGGGRGGWSFQIETRRWGNTIKILSDWVHIQDPSWIIFCPKSCWVNHYCLLFFIKKFASYIGTTPLIDQSKFATVCHFESSLHSSDVLHNRLIGLGSEICLRKWVAQSCRQRETSMRI
jgi:hypothetical protein